MLWPVQGERMDNYLNFYIELEPGKLADLEVVAKSSLSFSEVVKEIAYVVDPSLVIRLEFESGTEGSLSVNSVVKFLRQQVYDPFVRKTVIIAVLVWFGQEAGSALLGDTVLGLIKDDPAISEDDAERIAEKVTEILERKIGKKSVQKVFREVKKDPNITGIGASNQKGAKPKSIVPKNEFSARSSDKIEEQEALHRVRTERMILTLISPVLQKSSNKWRFNSKDGNIYIGIKDEAFLDSIVTGKADIKMKSGIVFLADVEIEEEFKYEVWNIRERNITNVIDVSTAENVGDLFSDVRGSRKDDQ